MNRADLFHRDNLGRLLRRKDGIWSSVAPSCLDCGTTEKKHYCRGRCQSCYMRWKRATDPEWKARVNANHKLSSIRNAARVEARDRKRASDPKRREQRRVISKRWADKNSKWPVGGLVQYELIPGHWVTGTIIEKTRGKCHVQFKTYSEWIAKAKLASLVEREAA